jgi:hypothetical protein
MFDKGLGLAFEHYHNKFPNKTIEILECGNSNIHTEGYHITDEEIAQEYVEWLQRVFGYPYINSASFFILSSHDEANWGFFSWRTEAHWKKPVVRRVGQMNRPPREGAPVTVVHHVHHATPQGITNQHVITAFYNVSRNLGLGNWTLMGRAGIRLSGLTANRDAPYSGPDIDQLPGLTDEQKWLIKEELQKQVGPTDAPLEPARQVAGFLWERAELANAPLAFPLEEQIDLADTANRLEMRAAMIWNRYGFLLTELASLLRIDPDVAVAVLAAQANEQGFARSKRLLIRFEVHTFYERWGRENEGRFREHFRFDPDRPWQKHEWRPKAEEDWRTCHGWLAREWDVFEFACLLDETAARLSTGIGLPQMMGFTHAAIGYESAKQMFDAFSSSERYQIFAVFDLLGGGSINSRLLRALRDRDFDAFAALHYGSGRAARYATMLGDLYRAIQRLKLF